MEDALRRTGKKPHGDPDEDADRRELTAVLHEDLPRLDRAVLPAGQAEQASEGTGSVGELLRTDLQAELSRRDGDWTAFGAQLAARLDREARAEQARPLEAHALAVLQREVDRELGEMAPRFDGDFGAAVDAHMREVEAGDPPLGSCGVRGMSFGRSLLRAVRRAVALEDRGFGLAAAAVAAVFFLEAERVVQGSKTGVDSRLSKAGLARKLRQLGYARAQVLDELKARVDRGARVTLEMPSRRQNLQVKLLQAKPSLRPYRLELGWSSPCPRNGFR